MNEHWSDEKNNPAGGVSSGVGYCISWQNGPLGRDKERKEPSGAFVENIIKAVVSRLEFYQSGKFACDRNSGALAHLNHALENLDSRTKEREERKVEGIHSL